MGKEAKTNAMRMLERAGVAYDVYTYNYEDDKIDGCSVAAKLGQNPRQVFKTLVTQGKSNYFVFIIPVEAELDLKKAASAAGEKAVSMIPVSELVKVTGYIRGGCSPVGMKKVYPTFLDTSALEFEKIMISGGRVGTQLSISPYVLPELIQSQTAAICAN